MCAVSHIALSLANSRCIVLDPIPTKNLTIEDVDELANTTREVMLKELIALTEKAQGRRIPMAVPASSASQGKSTSVDKI